MFKKLPLLENVGIFQLYIYFYSIKDRKGEISITDISQILAKIQTSQHFIIDALKIELLTAHAH